VKCRKCGDTAALELRRHNAAFCTPHFVEFFRKQVREAIRQHRMFGPDERILVAVSGGKDSLALWDVLLEEGYATAGLYLDLANRALSRNVRVSPWIHVESEGRHLGIARVGDRLEMRAKVKRLFEKKGHEFVELDLLLVAEGTRPIASIRHVAIYQLRGAST
jgi:acyl dehydratase